MPLVISALSISSNFVASANTPSIAVVVVCALCNKSLLVTRTQSAYCIYKEKAEANPTVTKISR